MNSDQTDDPGSRTNTPMRVRNANESSGLTGLHERSNGANRFKGVVDRAIEVDEENRKDSFLTSRSQLAEELKKIKELVNDNQNSYNKKHD